ncbi:conserved hypothetical protein [Chthoniobacter flavus Ellin428]|uniref:Uncharacterized protein n=1 Tax=Chthoniobacter flavus Ellin428 TaxID=497964 RepID=B4D4Y9_9BACT|nr:hypothetical protein [Chthoniobacter flavus]EDY18592.1 conserved hypothetical protein [Chthoniobacter flavus Ellin428]TCO90952.1 hypothetical protein EV701_109102 [Chthoniobacter flavus]
MKSFYKIPADIYERVHEGVLAIVNASQAGDDVLSASHYGQLREFCEQQTAAGRGSGFMWEALADVTDDSIERLACYERSLALAQHNSEPTHTVLLAIGQHHAEAGDWLHAEPLLIAARQQAIAFGDVDTEGEAASLLLQVPTNDA